MKSKVSLLFAKIDEIFCVWQKTSLAVLYQKVVLFRHFFSIFSVLITIWLFIYRQNTFWYDTTCKLFHCFELLLYIRWRKSYGKLKVINKELVISFFNCKSVEMSLFLETEKYGYSDFWESIVCIHLNNLWSYLSKT